MKSYTTQATISIDLKIDAENRAEATDLTNRFMSSIEWDSGPQIWVADYQSTIGKMTERDGYAQPILKEVKE